MSIQPQLQALILKYDRAKGFTQIENLEKITTDQASEFLNTYISKLEKDPRFREITYKLIIRVLFILAFIVLIVLLSLANFLSAFICFTIVLGLGYFLGYLQAKKLRAVTEEYNLKIAGSDWDYFGCYIENKFGPRKWTFYAFLPFLCPTIQLYVKLRPRPSQIDPTKNREIDNNQLILSRIKALQESSKFAVPIKEKDIRAMINQKYAEDESIEVGNHDAQQTKKIEAEKLFS